MDKILTKLNPSSSIIYKRTTGRTGGDPVTGRGVTVSNTDVLLNPQPAITYITATLLTRANRNTQVVVTSGVAQIGDILCTCSATNITRSELNNKDVSIVLVDGSTEDQREIVEFTPYMLNGIDVAFDILLRRKKF